LNDISDLSLSTDKPLIALYVGDWDPSGLHMSNVDLPERLERYGADLTLLRIALLADDLQALPSFDVESKKTDPRYRWFQKNIGTACYELDAMPPPTLRARTEAEIRSYIDLPAWEHARMVERAEVESMKEFHKSWQASICSKGDEHDED
jgi:hypothetical protein